MTVGGLRDKAHKLEFLGVMRSGAKNAESLSQSHWRGEG